MSEPTINGETEIEFEEEERIEVQQFTIRRADLLGFLRHIVREAHVNRVLIRNANGRTLLEIPLYLGLASVALLQVWAAVAVLVGLAAEVTVTVERRGKVARSEPEVIAMMADEPAGSPKALQRVIGIGPKAAEVLYDGGIRTLAGLAQATPVRLRDILDAAGPQFDHINPTTWPEQARQLAG